MAYLAAVAAVALILQHLQIRRMRAEYHELARGIAERKGGDGGVAPVKGNRFGLYDAKAEPGIWETMKMRADDSDIAS